MMPGEISATGSHQSISPALSKARVTTEGIVSAELQPENEFAEETSDDSMDNALDINLKAQEEWSLEVSDDEE